MRAAALLQGLVVEILWAQDTSVSLSFLRSRCMGRLQAVNGIPALADPRNGCRQRTGTANRNHLPPVTAPLPQPRLRGFFFAGTGAFTTLTGLRSAPGSRSSASARILRTCGSVARRSVEMA